MLELFFQRYPQVIFSVGLGLIMASYASSYQINADSLVQRNTYLDGFLIWSNLVSDIGLCATLCIRMKMCMSFNFDLSTRKCDLNSELMENHLYNGKSGQNVLYSRSQDWPPEVCFYSPKFNHTQIISTLLLINFIFNLDFQCVLGDVACGRSKVLHKF